MTEEKKKLAIGSIGVIYNSGHMTIYAGDKAINTNGALKVVFIVGFSGDNPLYVEYSDKREFPKNKTKIV